MAGARKPQAAAQMTAHIRREIATETNLRALKALPAFRTEDDLPKSLKRLLDKLKDAEDKPERR